MGWLVDSPLGLNPVYLTSIESLSCFSVFFSDQNISPKFPGVEESASCKPIGEVDQCTVSIDQLNITGLFVVLARIRHLGSIE